MDDGWYSCIDHMEEQINAFLRLFKKLLRLLTFMHIEQNSINSFLEEKYV